MDRVNLIDSNQSFACIRYPDGRESTVSVQDLAPDPAGSETFSPQQMFQQSSEEIPSKPATVEPPTMQNEPLMSPGSHANIEDSSYREIVQTLRRSDRVSVTPKRYGWD